MTIDERLERLTERHEALTQNVELMAREYEQRFKQSERLTTQVLEGIARLLNVVEIHERRITELEAGERK